MDASTPAQLFGRQLAELRATAGLSQRGFARRIEERVGVSMDPATLARIEKAKGKRVTLDEVFTLAAGLGVSPMHLLAPRAGKGSVRIAATAHDHRAVRAWLRGSAPLDAEHDADGWELGALPDEGFKDRLAELERVAAQAGARVRFLVSALERARAEWMDTNSHLLQVQHEHESGASTDLEELAAAELAMEAADRRHTTYEQELGAASTDHSVAQREVEALRRSMDEMGY